MSSIRFTAFGAASVPLSKVIPDSDFDIRPYGITAAFAKVPYRPIAWQKEELDWGDIEPHVIGEITETIHDVRSETTLFEYTTPGVGKFLYQLTGVMGSYYQNTYDWKVYANGDVVYTYTGSSTAILTERFTLEPLTEVRITAKVNSAYHDTNGILAGTKFENLGIHFGGKTFDLTGKWLALGLDMKGLAATVKIQGVEMPYSDYMYYFPIAPTELKIPDNWDISQERPIIEVYK